MKQSYINHFYLSFMSCNLASSISYDVMVQLLDIFRYQSVLKVMTASKAVINSLLKLV